MSLLNENAELFKMDAWLSQSLAIPSFSMTTMNADRMSILRQMAKPEPSFFFAKVPAAEVWTASLLSDCGFKVVDTQLTFEKVSRIPVPKPADVEVARPEHRGAILDIAGSCFVYSRFHLDPLISTERANTVKRKWVENCLDGKRGAEVLVALTDGIPVGFMCVLELSQGRSAVIDLLGVEKNSQRLGVGSALLDAFSNRWQDKVDSFVVGTQAANTPSVRLYERRGFRLKNACYVMHAHTGG